MAVPPSLSPAAHERKPRLMTRWYVWLLIVAAAYAIAAVMHWDTRVKLWVVERMTPQAQRDAAVWLPDYRAFIDGKALPGMEKDEASDLTYNPDTRTLFSVMGKNAFLVELTLEGDVLRKMPLKGWSNPEGVAYIGGGKMAITDERQHLMTVVKVTADTQALTLADWPQFDLGPSANQNKGYEGIAWDPRRGQLLLGEERPAAMYSLKVDANGQWQGAKVKLPFSTLNLRNLSSLGIDPRTGNTLVLSADSHMLLELDPSGRQVSYMTLLGGLNGLKDTIPRAEGVAMDESGTLYMVSEPNLFYVFRKF
ncbi:SdiA-regulated domain-containing protein [Pseudomonas eucalypticola]|uniref:SdiA-regulated domain-containing protein n=1 Tax=Pseudomonas eucalypticola TaxID=2599595 RepID=A0A7D5H4B8_9PSED|nr:SdiA-regulated domain-containing protein [Pseudomonas eucalypticola]QKZ07345.1 SdiA-regulated domain-containing protein [Pseudomonas eucalypticola]